MPDRLDPSWIDALAGRVDAADAARMAASVAHDPGAAEAFEGWRRLASAVRDDAAARAGGLPPLDGVLAAIRTPAAYGDGPTALDRMGRATLRRLAAEPIAASAPSPVPGWVIGAAAVAAMFVFALWPTSHGPLGGVLLTALRQQAPQPEVAAAMDPTPVARLRDGAAQLKLAQLKRDREAMAEDALRASAGGVIGARAASDRAGAAAGAPVEGTLPWPDGVPGGRSRVTGAAGARTGPQRPGSAGAAGPGSAPGQGAPPAWDEGGYPAPQASPDAYPPPSPPVSAGRGGEGRKPSKPPKPSATPSPEPTPPPPTDPPPTATPAASTVVGHVVGADGGGRAQVRVAAYRRDDGPIGGSWIETFTADASGRYTLTLAPGTWQLYAEAPGHRPQWWQNADRPEGGQGVELAIGQALGADWQLAASGGGDGLLVGEAGAHAWIRAVAEGTDPTTTAGPSALADGDGHFALPLPAGRWAVARADDGRDRGWRALAEVVEVVAGASTTVAWP